MRSCLRGCWLLLHRSRWLLCMHAWGSGMLLLCCNCWLGCLQGRRLWLHCWAAYHLWWLSGELLSVLLVEIRDFTLYNRQDCPCFGLSLMHQQLHKTHWLLAVLQACLHQL